MERKTSKCKEGGNGDPFSQFVYELKIEIDFDRFCQFQKQKKINLHSAWIKIEQLKPYHPHKEEMIKINKGKRFQQAVDAVEDFLKKAKGKEQVK